MIGAVVAKPGFHLDDEKRGLLFSILKQFDVLLVSEDMGGEYFINGLGRTGQMKVVSVGSIEEEVYPLRFDEFVLKAGRHGAQIIVTVGGDGIASYMATAIIRQSSRIPHGMGIFGFPAGTANVGPIVQNIKQDTPDVILRKRQGMDSIEVKCAGKVLGYGFNDVIIGWTFLGTLGDKWVNLNARAMALKGEAVEEHDPDRGVTGPGFSVSLNGREQSIPSFYSIRQICISTLHQDNLYGRAITGSFIEASAFEHPAAVALLDKFSTDAREETWGEKRFRSTSHLCFDDTDRIRIDGIAEGACVIIDGNPFVLEENSIDLRCVPESVTVYGIGG